MALKSSQPRRSASPRSDSSILRMGYVAASPKTCRPNFAMLSEYVVAMDATSRARSSGGQNDAPQPACLRIDVRESRSSRVRQTQVHRKELSRTKLVATCPTSLARLASNSTHENSTHGRVNCARWRSFGALRHHRAIVLAPVWRIPTFSIDLLTRGATRIILTFRRPDPMISGRNVCSVPRFDVATGQSGRGKTHCDGACEVGHRDRCELRPLIRLRCL